jgi:hypothetical protein
MVVEMHYHQPSVFRNGYSQAQEMNWNVEFFLTPGMIGSTVLRRTSVQYFLSSDWAILRPELIDVMEPKSGLNQTVTSEV